MAGFRGKVDGNLEFQLWCSHEPRRKYVCWATMKNASRKFCHTYYYSGLGRLLNVYSVISGALFDAFLATWKVRNRSTDHPVSVTWSRRQAAPEKRRPRFNPRSGSGKRISWGIYRAWAPSNTRVSPGKNTCLIVKGTMMCFIIPL